MTKLYRVTAYVLDLNGDCPDKKSVIENIEHNRHPEFISVEEVFETDCGEWDDDHELNKTNAPYEKYFPHLNPNITHQDLIEAYKELIVQNMKLLDQRDAAIRQARYESHELAKLKKVQEFVKTIGELTK